MRDDLEPLAKVAHALVVMAGDLELDPRHRNRMVDVVGVARPAGVRRGLEAAIADVGPQRPAARHVQHLQPAADAEHRHLPLAGRRQQRQLQRVALRLRVAQPRFVHVAAEGAAAGRHVAAAREHQQRIALQRINAIDALGSEARFRQPVSIFF